MSGTLATQLIARLGFAAYELDQDDRFRAIAESPAWWPKVSALLLPDGDRFSLAEDALFLQEFMQEATIFWQENRAGWLASGIWQEVTEDGSSYLLEALATRLGRARVLLFKHADRSVDERISLLQRSRENTLAYNQDIAQREQLAAELHRAKQAAEDLSQAKSEFLARMSHELRTPMSSVIGMTQLLLESDPTGEQRGYLEAVRDSGRALLDIINDILDFSKAEAGAMKLSRISFSLRGLLGDSLKLFEGLARGKGLRLTHFVEAEVPDQLVGDPLRLRQILFNVVGNAIKFTEEGQVAVEVCLVSQTGETAEMQFAVRDNGIGIEQQKRDLVFDAFAQAGSLTSGREGTGLGLSIARQLTEMMNGRIWLEDSSPQGSTFCFTARFGIAVAEVRDPANLSGEQAATTNILACKRSLNILVAEDNPLNLQVAVRMLEKRGHKMSAVDNGVKALDALEHGEFDIILMDCNMPELNGFEAAAAIRQREQNSGRHVPIIALTADASAEVSQQCYAAGMDAYVTKPLDADEVNRLMLDLTSPSNDTRE